MADKKISAATLVITPAATDQYATNQGGASKRTTRAQIHALESGEHFVFPQVDEIATPTLAFGDADSGFDEPSDDVVRLSLAGIEGIRWTGLNSGVVQAPFADVAITALAGGGQGGVGILINSYNNITVAATTGDSVTLPATFAVNSLIHIKNNGANDVDVFPGSGDDLGAGADTAVSLAAGDGITYLATVADTTWIEFTIAGSVSDPLLLSLGLIGAPSHSFTGDPDTGVWSSGADILSFSAGGKEIARLQEVAGAEQFIISPGFVENNPSFPALAFGDGNTGFYESSDNVLNLALAGAAQWTFSGTFFQGAAAGGPAIINVNSTATVPNLRPDSGDLNTGIGASGGDQLSLIAGAIEGLRVTEISDGAIVSYDFTGGITAFSGGGQGSAVVLKKSYNVITTVAAGGDSVKLPTTFDQGAVIFIKNNGANAADVFPNTSDDLGQGSNLAESLAAGASTAYIASTANGIWTPLIVSSESTPDPLLLSLGLIGAPSHSFTGDPDTGVWSSGADILSFSAGGKEIARLQEVAGAEQFIISPGFIENNAAFPALAFGDGDTGFFEESANLIVFSGAGVSRFYLHSTGLLRVDTSGFGIMTLTPTATAPNILPARVDADTGMGTSGLDELSLIAGAQEALRFVELNSGVVQVPAADVAITALAGGGQGGAGVLKQSYNVISISATTGDSVTLPAVFAVNSVVYIKNDGANSVDVFPASGDDLGKGADTAEALAAGKSAEYIATTANATWTPFAVPASGAAAAQDFVLKTDAYTLVAGDRISIEVAVAKTVTVAATVAVPDEFIVHNSSASTGVVSIEPNTGHTIRGPAGNAVGGTDTITLAAGETIRILTVSASLLEIL